MRLKEFNFIHILKQGSKVAIFNSLTMEYKIIGVDDFLVKYKEFKESKNKSESDLFRFIESNKLLLQRNKGILLDAYQKWYLRK